MVDNKEHNYRPPNSVSKNLPTDSIIAFSHCFVHQHPATSHNCSTLFHLKLSVSAACIFIQLQRNVLR